MLALNQSGTFRVTQNEMAAQASLVFDTDYRSGGQQFVRPRLITRNKRVLWQGPLVPVSDNQTQSQARAVAEELQRALKEDLARAKAKD